MGPNLIFFTDLCVKYLDYLVVVLSAQEMAKLEGCLPLVCLS